MARNNLGEASAAIDYTKRREDGGEERFTEDRVEHAQSKDVRHVSGVFQRSTLSKLQCLFLA